jgi:hypothetical protein
LSIFQKSRFKSISEDQDVMHRQVVFEDRFKKEFLWEEKRIRMHKKTCINAQFSVQEDKKYGN